MHRKRHSLSYFKLGLVLALAMPAAVTAQPAKHSTPTLIVQITVDGLRGDLISRYWDGLGENGFKRLIGNGVWYTNAHHQHANTETIVGHTTLATGAHPSEHGMIGNAWFDRASGRLGYNIEDADFPLLPVGTKVEGAVQVDPTQAAASVSGRSPRNILTTTFSDELVKSNAGKSKVFSVSGKDRSAVAMAGHAGKAFWMSTVTGAFETSSYYYERYPDWVAEWNAGAPADKFAGRDWSLSGDPETYLLYANDDRDVEVDLKGFGKTFPHRFGQPEDGMFYTQVLVSAEGDALTADFAKSLLTAENLGADAFTDYLSVSFSSVDAVNHFFGPSSLENEENVRRVDATIGDLISFIDAQIGAENVLFVLSADHGMPEMPEYMSEFGLMAPRNYVDVLKPDLNQMIEGRFGIKRAVREFFRPYIYLDHKAIADAGANVRDIERAIVDHLMAVDGISIALPMAPFPEQVGDYLQMPIRRNFHPLRSGDIYVAQAPYAFLFSKGPIAAMHGSPWKYDTHVPVIFSGRWIPQARVGREIATVDVAATLSEAFGLTLPSGTAGQVLPEVITHSVSK